MHVLSIINYSTIQDSLLFKCGFLDRLMDELSLSSGSNSYENRNEFNSNMGKSESAIKERADENWLLAGSRCPLLGHLVQIAQVFIL